MSSQTQWIYKEIEQEVTRVSSDLEDLLLQAVDTQRSFGEIQADSVIADAVHHVEVGLWAAATDGHGDAEDIATAALCLWTHKNLTPGKLQIVKKEGYILKCLVLFQQSPQNYLVHSDKRQRRELRAWN